MEGLCGGEACRVEEPNKRPNMAPI